MIKVKIALWGVLISPDWRMGILAVLQGSTIQLAEQRVDEFGVREQDPEREREREVSPGKLQGQIPGWNQVPLKLNSFTEIIINLSIQNFISFLVPSDLNAVLTEH